MFFLDIWFTTYRRHGRHVRANQDSVLGLRLDRFHVAFDFEWLRVVTGVLTAVCPRWLRSFTQI